MKKLLLINTLVLVVVIKSVAQGPTLTSSNITPTVGEVFQNQYAKTVGVSTLGGGANQTWNYSTLTDSNASVVAEVVTPASTPYADSFPTSNLAIKAGNDSGFLYFNSQTGELSELGAVSPAAGIIRYTKPKVYLAYPFTYTNFFSDSVVEESPSYNIALRGKDSLTAEGYGNLEIPGKTYNNVLRIKYIENVTGTKDSVITTTIGGFPVTITAQIKFNVRTISYLYFTPDTHAPLLTYEETKVIIKATAAGLQLFDSSSTIADISYLKNYILPLSFTTFKAQLNGKEVSLQWQTAQEINTSNFIVQRGVNGKDFSGIADVKATGNSSGAHYSYADQSFVKTEVPPAVYYRIKETDKDGKEFYSSVAIIHGNTISLNIYPNPVKSYINFNSSNAAVADAIIIFDAKGHIVQQLNNHSLSQPVNVSTLSKGAYFIKIKLGDKTISSTIVKE